MIPLALALALASEPSVVMERDGRPCEQRSDTCGVWMPEPRYRALARSLEREALLAEQVVALRAEAAALVSAVRSATTAADLEHRASAMLAASPPPAELAIPWWAVLVAGGAGLAVGWIAGRTAAPPVAVVTP